MNDEAALKNPRTSSANGDKWRYLKNNLTERQVIKIWQHLLANRTTLTTEGGEHIRVIYPGRPNDNRGPDFRDAVIATEQGLVKGDIEIHVTSSNWRGHRHHLDKAYNQVILHVVMWQNDNLTTLQNGVIVPVLALDRYLANPMSQHPDPVCSRTALGMPCLKTAHSLNASLITEFLDRAGEERFRLKASQFQSDIMQTGAGQSLYRGIMGALGYAKNKRPCLELARRVPLLVLESIYRENVTDEECLTRQQALLLGTAGLLPSQRPDCLHANKSNDLWINELERMWHTRHDTEPMPAGAWHLFKVRPSNLPIRRIVAMSYLIFHYREKGLFRGMVDIINEAAPDEGHRRLETGLTITSSGRWTHYLDFGRPSQVKMPTLLGRYRVADIIVNVILPFTFAWGEITSQPDMQQKSFALYHRYPRLMINSVERHMSRQLGLDRHLVNSAQRQQGLIHIHNSLCVEGKCDRCCLGDYR